MTFCEFRQEKQRVLFLDKVVLEFLNIPNGQTIIVTTLHEPSKPKDKYFSNYPKLGAASVGAYEAFEIYKYLTQ